MIVAESGNEIDLGEALEVLEEAAGAELPTGHPVAKAANELVGGFGTFFKLARDIKHVEMALNDLRNDDLHWNEWNNRIGLAIWGLSAGQGRPRIVRAVECQIQWEQTRRTICAGRVCASRRQIGPEWERSGIWQKNVSPDAWTGKPVNQDIAPRHPGHRSARGGNSPQRRSHRILPARRRADAACHGRRRCFARAPHAGCAAGRDNLDLLRNQLDKVAAWMRFSSKQNKDVPHRRAARYRQRHPFTSRRMAFPRMPALSLHRPCDQIGPTAAEGYDEATRLLLVAPPRLPPIPDRPTRDDALAALKLLEGLLEEFPFVEGGVAKAVALSCLISPVVRGAFATAPLHAILAHAAASGKSYLADISSTIASGKPMPVMSAAGSEDELEKRLVAALLSGQSMLSIDNVNGELRSIFVSDTHTTDR